MKKQGGIAFCWENFGPSHVDRCDAVASHITNVKVIGLEYKTASDVYSWQAANGTNFRKVTRPSKNRSTNLMLSLWLVKQVRAAKAHHVFLCHYNEMSTQVAAILMRSLGLRVYLMADSKFDDVPRKIWWEVGKAIWLRPYVGAIVGSERTQSYFRFLGFRRRHVELGYDTISVSRIRQLAGDLPAPKGVPHAARHITIVARLVHKKNLFLTLQGFSIYARAASSPRQLRILGDGPLDEPLKNYAKELGIDHLVTFEGFLQTADVCRALASSLVLLLNSTEEQFGIAIIEALAMGVPIIASDRCGARDEFVRTGVNGFIIEPDNPDAVAFFLQRLCEDEALWTDLASNAADGADRADANVFARSVKRLVCSSA